MIAPGAAEADVLAVARAAVRALRVDRTARRSLYRHLPALREQRLLLRDAPPGPAWTHRIGTASWWLGFGTGTVAVLTATALLGPPGRRNATIDPSFAIAVAIPAGVVAVVLLAPVLVLRVPGGETARAGAVLGWVTAIVAGALVAYRLVVGSDDGRGFGDEELARWRPWALAALVLLLAVAGRLDRLRRRIPRSPGVGSRERDRHLRRRTTELASLPVGAAARDVWAQRLDRLAGTGVDPVVVRDAREVGPVAWLVAVYDDPRFDVAGLLAGS